MASKVLKSYFGMMAELVLGFSDFYTIGPCTLYYNSGNKTKVQVQYLIHIINPKAQTESKSPIPLILSPPQKKTRINKNKNVPFPFLT